METGAFMSCGLINVVFLLFQSPSSERSQNGSSSDLRKRESRNSKPGSPSLHDPYTLFKFDKVTVLTFVLLITFICCMYW